MWVDLCLLGDNELKKDFFDLFVEKLAILAPAYNKRRFNGVKGKTSDISDTMLDDIKSSFSSILFGDALSDDHQES